MSELKLGASVTLEELHERTWELASRFSYLIIVFGDAGQNDWVDLCSEAETGVQCIREGLGIALDHPEVELTFMPEHIARGGIIAAQIVERLASAEVKRLGLE